MVRKRFQSYDCRVHACCVFRDEMSALVDEVVRSTKKLIKATEREIDKWRR